jgi:hypothetical protein
MVEPSDRTGKDYFHFALASFGEIIATAGVVIVSWRTCVCGLVMMALALAYFAMQD